jgi:hypothetical protein
MVESMRAALARLVLPSSIWRLWAICGLRLGERPTSGLSITLRSSADASRQPPWARRYPHRTLTLATSAATTDWTGWLGAGSINELRSGDR